MMKRILQYFNIFFLKKENADTQLKEVKIGGEVYDIRSDMFVKRTQDVAIKLENPETFIGDVHKTAVWETDSAKVMSEQPKKKKVHTCTGILYP